MIVTIHTQGLHTLAQIRAFVEGNEPISFTLTDRQSAYGWMADTLKAFGYVRCKRADRGLLRDNQRLSAHPLVLFALTGTRTSSSCFIALSRVASSFINA